VALVLLLGACAHTPSTQREISVTRQPMRLALAETLLAASKCAYLADQFADDDAKYLTDYAPCREVGYIGSPVVRVSENGTDAYLILETDKHVIVAFRGTLPIKNYFDVAVTRDWLHAVWDSPKERFKEFPGQVHEGFGKSLNALYPVLLQDLENLQAKQPAWKPVLVTGHSKGGALAALFAYRLAQLETPHPPEAVYTFAAPRAGDNGFAQEYARLGLNHWRFEYGNDLIPHFPQDGENGDLMNCAGDTHFTVPRLLGDYTHIGQLEYLTRNGADPVKLETCEDKLRFSRINDLNKKGRAIACGRERLGIFKEAHKIQAY
jgi:hypothetical protein